MTWFQDKEFLLDASRHERNEGQRRKNNVRDEGVDHTGKRGCNSDKIINTVNWEKKEKKKMRD